MRRTTELYESDVVIIQQTSPKEAKRLLTIEQAVGDQAAGIVRLVVLRCDWFTVSAVKIRTSDSFHQ